MGAAAPARQKDVSEQQKKGAGKAPFQEKLLSSEY
jgi:hypothetical protein